MPKVHFRHFFKYHAFSKKYLAIKCKEITIKHKRGALSAPLFYFHFGSYAKIIAERSKIRYPRN